MKIDLKKLLMAGTAIVAMGTVGGSGEALAQCASTGNIAADCTMLDPATTGAITINNGVTLTFTSAGQTFTVDHTIDGAAANSGTLASGGSASNILFQSSVGSFGSGNTLAGATIGSGDTWFLSGGGSGFNGADIFLASGGTFQINGGTLSFVSSGSIVGGFGSTKDITFAGSSSADTVSFTSGSQNVIYASSFDLGAGNDVITFSSTGDNNIDVKTFTTGAGDDSITFNSGAITVEGAAADTVGGGIFDLGDGNDTITFNSTGGAITALNGFTAGAGNDTVTFISSATINVGTSTFDMGSGDDTVTFQSGGTIITGNLDGGTGTDTISFNSSGFHVLTYDVSNFETANIGSQTDIEFSSAGFSGSTAVIMYDSSSLAFTNLSTETIAGTITGNDGDQVIYLSNGGATVSSTISLGGGADRLVYSSGSLTGTVDFGAGADVLVVGDNTVAGSNTLITAAMSNLEQVLQASGAVVTLSAALTGVNDANDDGYNLDTGTLVIESGASIDGAIHGTAAGAIKFFSSGVDGTYNLGGIIEDVQIFQSAGTVNTNGFAIGGNSPVARLFISAGTFNASDNVTTASLTNSGTLNVDYDAQINAGASNVTGGGTYGFVYFSSNGTEQIGGITTTGNIDFSSASLVFSVAPNSGVVQTGDDVIYFASGTAVTAALSVTDTSFLYDFAQDVVNPGRLDITQSTSLQDATTTGNNLNTATVLLTDPDLTGTTDSNLQALQSAVSGASTQEAFNDALEQAQPTVDGSSFVASSTLITNSFSIVGDRLASLRQGGDVTGMTTGNLTQGVRAWTQGFAAKGEQDRRDGIDGYDFTTFGGAFGADSEDIFEDTVIGLALSYADTDADSDNGSRTSTQTDSYQVTLYADHDLDSRTYLNGLASYTFNDVETSRTVVNSTASGDFDANQFTFRAELGRDYAYETATLTPHVLGHWTHYDPDSYTETGAGGAGLVVNQDSVDVVELGVGLDVSWLYRNADGSYFSPELSVGYRYDFADDDVEMTSRFIGGGQAFTTSGFDPQQSTLDADIGFTYFSTDNWELTAEYDYEWKEDFDSHAGMARAAYRF